MNANALRLAWLGPPISSLPPQYFPHEHFLKHYNGQNSHFTRFYQHQNVASPIHTLFSVIRRQMSPFDPFRGEGRQKGTMSPFFTVFFVG